MTAPGTFSYPGSKTGLASWIISHIPEHHLYVEPFGGAASVLVNKPRSDIEVYNDLNGDCVTFFRASRDRPKELARWVKRTPYSRQLFNEYVESYPDWPEDIVEHAGRFYFVQSANFGGKLIGSAETPSFKVAKAGSYGNAGGSGKAWDNTNIEALSQRFKRVIIEQLDYEDIIDKYDHPNAFFYFDPPYVDVGDGYYLTEEGGFDHSRFTKLLHDMDAKWLVSYDQNIPSGLSEYRTVSRNKVAKMSAQRPEKVETLTANYDIDGEPLMTELGQQTLSTIAD